MIAILSMVVRRIRMTMIISVAINGVLEELVAILAKFLAPKTSVMSAFD